MASILCPSCHKLISEDAESCIHCGQRKPGLWGATAAARKLGLRIDFSNVIAGLCIGLSCWGWRSTRVRYLTSAIRYSSYLPVWKPALSSATGSQPSCRLWWTFAIYLHGGLLHIFFNTMWIRQLRRSSEVLDRFASSSYLPLPASLDLSPLRWRAFARHRLHFRTARRLAYGRRVAFPVHPSVYAVGRLIFVMGFIARRRHRRRRLCRRLYSRLTPRAFNESRRGRCLSGRRAVRLGYGRRFYAPTAGRLGPLLNRP